jgi:hypothetical protein
MAAGAHHLPPDSWPTSPPARSATIVVSDCQDAPVDCVYGPGGAADPLCAVRGVFDRGIFVPRHSGQSRARADFSKLSERSVSAGWYLDPSQHFGIVLLLVRRRDTVVQGLRRDAPAGPLYSLLRDAPTPWRLYGPGRRDVQ